MTEILDAVWGGFLTGFKYVGIAGGFICGAYFALILACFTWVIFNRWDYKLGRKEKLS